MKGELSECWTRIIRILRSPFHSELSCLRFYVASALSIQDVTELAHMIGSAHADGSPLPVELPTERPYLPWGPQVSGELLLRLRLAVPSEEPELAKLAKPASQEAEHACFVCTACGLASEDPG